MLTLKTNAKDSPTMHRPRLGVIFLLICLGFSILFSFSCSGKQEEGHSMLPIGNVDVPQSGAKVTGTFLAGGWALSADGISDVSVYVDRTFTTSTTLGVSRPDVLKVFPQYTNIKDPGWNLVVNLSGVSVGSHEVVIQARSNKGAVRDIGFLQINVVQ